MSSAVATHIILQCLCGAKPWRTPIKDLEHLYLGDIKCIECRRRGGVHIIEVVWQQNG